MALPLFLKPKNLYHMKRLGKNNDGGYLCGINSINETKTLISFGINDDFSFEKDFSILNQPIGEFFYSPYKKNIDYDKNYTNSIREQLEALQNAISNRQRQIKEEQKNKKKYTPEQLDSNNKNRKEDQCTQMLESKKEKQTNS